MARRHQSEEVIDARLALFNAWGVWCPVMLHLLRLMVASSRVSVNHGEGGTALDPLARDQGSSEKHRKVGIRVHVDDAALPGPPGFLDGPWVQVVLSLALMSPPDLSVCLLCKFSSFLGSLHWPADLGDLGHHSQVAQ